MASRRDLILLLPIVGIALLLRIWGIGFGLPFTYHPDEHQYVDTALGFLGGDLNPHRFNNPALFKYLLAALYALWYLIGRGLGAFESVAAFQSWATADPTPVYLLARLTSALLGTATVAITYGLGRLAYDGRTGLLAATLLAGTFLHARDSHYAVNDVPATFFVTMALFFSLRVLQRGRLQDYGLAGLCAGLATATKYTGLLLLVPLLLAHLLAGGARPRDRAARLASRWLLAGLGAFVGAYLLGAPYSVLDWPAFLADLKTLMIRGSTGFKGLQLDPASGWLFYLKTLLWGMGLPLALASILGVLVALIRHRRQDLVLVAFPLILYLYMGRQLLIFARFLIPALPVLTLLAARTVWLAVERLPGGEGGQAVAVGVVAVVLLFQPVLDTVRHDYLLTRTDTRTLAKAWIEANIPNGAKIITQPNGPELAGADGHAPRSRRTYDLTVAGTTSLYKRPL
ncbi:MAG: ArnT family glycosyltransferase, partial [Anaerolineae bacterium]